MLLCHAWGQQGCGYRFKPSDQAQFDKAIESYKAKRYTESAASLRKLSARNPKAADPYFYLGMIAVKHDYNTAAIRRYFTKLLEVCPEYPSPLAYFYNGVILYTDNRFEEAVEMFDRYFSMSSMHPDPETDAVYEEASNYLYWSRFLAEAELNKAPFNPRVILGISSHEDEILPYISWDGSQAYYLRKVPLEKKKTYYVRDYEEKAWKMYMSRWRDTCFSTGEELPAPFNQHESEGGVSMTSDNRLLFYSVAERTKEGYNNCDIWYSEWKGGAWSEIKNAGRQVNGEKSWESQPSITPDGQYLYFASNRAGGIGGTDIWRCRRLPNGDWSRAENLGSSVNTAGNEKCPFIHADGHTLYFASDGWQGFGGYDMYFINISDASIQCPTNMGLPFNTEDDDICFGADAAGTHAYFAGRSVEYAGVGGRDVFRFELYPAARPEPMKPAVIQVCDSLGNPIEAVAVVRRYGADEARYLSDGKTGETVMMLSEKEDNVVSVEAEGFLPWVKVVRHGEMKRAKNHSEKALLKPLRLHAAIELPKDIFTGKDPILTAQGREILDQYAAFLQEHPMVHISIAGPSAAKVRAVYDYLLSKKLRKERLQIRQEAPSAQIQMKIIQL